MLSYAVCGLGGKMFTKLKLQSRSKKFGNHWLVKLYANIVRSRLMNTHIRIHYHFSTFSEYCERSTWQFDTNVINQTFWCVSHLFMLSSRCILNMKRLLTRTNNPFKISSKFSKQLGNLSIISLNSKDKEKALEHQKSPHRMDLIPGK